MITQYGGRTTEVLNTDAEGRLVLADAMAYAVDKLDPAVLVDVATLTGAIKVALGQRVGAFFANDEALAARLYDAGEASGEPLWRMPLESDYEDTLSSTIADAKNNPGGPGAITAALFLQHFAGDVPWAHLDLASVGDSPSDSYEWTTGPSGFGARALLTWLTGPEALAGVVAVTATCAVSPSGGRWRTPPTGVDRGARRLRRGHVVRPVQRAARPGLQDLADACRASGSRAATCSPTRPPGQRSRRRSPPERPRHPGRRSSAARRS